MRFSVTLILLAALAACTGAGADRPAAEGGVQFILEAREAPEAFDRTGLGRRLADGPPGLWAVVAGLPRPEAAVVRRMGADAEVVVSLFRGPRSQAAADIRLSDAAAEALGIGTAPEPVRVTALRQEPQLVSDR